jgi:hypothetical protein
VAKIQNIEVSMELSKDKLEAALILSSNVPMDHDDIYRALRMLLEDTEEKKDGSHVQ